MAIDDIFNRAGFPNGAFQTLLIGSQQVAGILDDERIKAVTLTGSGPAGSKVASQAGKRIKAEFEKRFVAGMQALRVGDPLDPNTQIGPLATPATRDELHTQVQDSLAQGARLLTGGEPLKGPVNYYPAYRAGQYPARIAGCLRRIVRPGGGPLSRGGPGPGHPAGEQFGFRPGRKRLDTRFAETAAFH